jgi:tetratricopeptide (TPR) repeat protein
VMLRRLSASPSWTLEMTELICADEQLPAAGCLGLLTTLAGLAMVEELGRPGQGRWRIPRAIGDDAAARLAAAGETELVGRRLRDYAAQRADYLVSVAHARVPVSASVLAELFRDYNADARNVRAALTWCLEHGEARAGLRICTGFGIYWIAAWAPAEGARWFGAFGAYLGGDGPAIPAAVRGPALAVRGQLAYHHGDLRGARTWALAGLELCRAARDLHYAAIALNVAAETATAAGAPEEALLFTDEALDLARSVWDSWNRVFALNVRAEALTALGRQGEAREAAATALALALETGHHWGAADARRRLGAAALAAGDLDEARDCYQAALPYLRTGMPPPDTARCLADLGQIALRQGGQDQGREFLAESLLLSLGAGSRAGIAETLLAFARLAAAAGNPGRAVQLAAAATALCASAGLPPPPDAQQYRPAPASPGRRGLGEAETGRLWAEGLRLTSRAAVQLALAPLAPSAPLAPAAPSVPPVRPGMPA